MKGYEVAFFSKFIKMLYLSKVDDSQGTQELKEEYNLKNVVRLFVERMGVLF